MAHAKATGTGGEQQAPDWRDSIVLAGVCLVLLFLFTYKQKALGQLAVRPLYLLGIAIALWICVYYSTSGFVKRKLTYGSRDEGLLLILFMLAFAYLTCQGFLYLESINALLYCLVTAFLTYALCTLSIVRLGAKRFLWVLTQGMIGYSVLNFVLLLLGVVRPDMFAMIQLSPEESGFGARLAGLLGDPTHLGTLLSVTLLLLFVSPYRPRPWFLVPFILADVVAMVIAGSRNSILSLALGCVVAVLLERRISRRVMKVVAGLVAVVIAASLVVLLYDPLREALLIIFRVDDPNAYSRLRIWGDMFGILSRLSPVEIAFGGGYQFIQGIYGSPYNAFLRVMFDHGILTLLMVAGFVVMMFVLILTERDDQIRKTAGALFIYWISFSMFLDTLYAEFFHVAEMCFWLAAALCTARAFAPRPETEIGAG